MIDRKRINRNIFACIDFLLYLLSCIIVGERFDDWIIHDGVF